MSVYRLEIAYDGTGFKGWARQQGLRTVQGEIEGALAELYGRPIPLTVAGRTDAGVHALGQVASFTAADPAAGGEGEGEVGPAAVSEGAGEVGAGAAREGGEEVGAGEPRHEPETIKRALNALTSAEIAIKGVAVGADGFDARRDARSRRYRYRILTASVPDPFERRYALHFPYRLDRDALESCAGSLAGTHDFTAFTPTETEHVRFERQILGAQWSDERAEWSDERSELLRFEIEADAFMRNMVRALVGTMLEVGTGRRSFEDFARLLEGRPRAEGGETAAAHGLFLLAVRY